MPALPFFLCLPAQILSGMALLLLTVLANPVELFEPAFCQDGPSLASIPRILAAIRMCPACDPEAMPVTQRSPVA